MQEKILDILKDTINNQYFYYLLIGMIILIILKNIWDFQKYKKDCKVLGQEVKTKGYIRNTLDDLILISVLSTISFMGYISLGYMKNEPEPANITEYIKELPTQKKNTKETYIKKEKSISEPIKLTIMETSPQKKTIEYQRREINKLRKEISKYKYNAKKCNEKLITLQKKEKKKPCKKREIISMRNGKVFKKEYVCN